MTTLKRLLDLLSPRERWRAAVLFAMIVVMALLEVIGVASVMPFLAVLASPEILEDNAYFAAAYDWLNFTDPNQFMQLLGAIVFVAFVVALAFKAATTYALLRFTNLRGHSIGKRLVAAYLRQPYEWFLNRHSADLGKTVLSEVQQVINGSLIPLMQAIAHGMVVIMLTGLLIIADPQLALVVGVGLGTAYCVIYFGLRRLLFRAGADRVRANKERYQILTEAFGGIKDVKVAGLEEAFLDRFRKPSLRHARHQATSLVAAQLPRYFLEILAFGGIILVTLYLLGGPGGLQSALPLIGLYAFAGYRLMPALQHVYADFAKIRFNQEALAVLHRDMMLLGSKHPIVVPPAPMPLEQGIRLDAISYNYPGSSRTAINDIDIHIPARTSIGLVGATGSGKTTTMDIVLGLLPPSSGRLLIDDVPIDAGNVRAWQRSIGYVPQSIFLSDDTVASNIAFGVERDRVDLSAVERAARIANLHAFVVRDLDNGYDTLVGERGVRLSGGQRQRIGIARAIYHTPKVLLLDEATSALDNVTEQAVMEAMENLGHEMTIILVAHRLSTVRACDRIFLLKQGKLAAAGTFDELSETNPDFARMVTGNI